VYRIVKRRVLIALAAVAALAGAAAVAAIAVTGSPGEVAEIAAAPPAAAGNGDSSEYVNCLNEHGWPVGPGLSIDPNGEAPAPGVIDAAVAACDQYDNGQLEQLRPSDEAFTELQQRSGNFRTCMSNHGVDVGAPDVFRNRVGIGVTFPGYDPSAPGFDDAYASCRGIMDVFG
jgi:hypothetical protein